MISIERVEDWLEGPSSLIKVQNKIFISIILIIQTGYWNLDDLERTQSRKATKCCSWWFPCKLPPIPLAQAGVTVKATVWEEPSGVSKNGAKRKSSRKFCHSFAFWSTLKSCQKCALIYSNVLGFKFRRLSKNRNTSFYLIVLLPIAWCPFWPPFMDHRVQLMHFLEKKCRLIFT